MIKGNKVVFDASLVGLKKVEIKPTQAIAKKALSFMKSEAELEVKLRELSEGTEPEALKMLEMITAQEELLESTNTFVFDVLKLTKAQKEKFEDLSIADSIVFAMNLSQAVMGMEAPEKGNQKSE
ncbi:phage tail tube assembly chaperone [Xylocopilactobacillus apis]|uniref:Phage tail assembly chaperone protein, TAC n=1 Tax=Xylocopilactobacillus apis TaxID=2932183 RepID=A0AAU9DJ89_9LACO|nr:phage tail tube assembly chaperone [Xylocopilactobacillus apis]BDR56877.1 hypothetical protein KIMC2_14390 [Xylocopilactobacillus apis]